MCPFVAAGGRLITDSDLIDGIKSGRTFNYNGELNVIEPRVTPLTAIMRKLRKKKVGDPLYKTRVFRRHFVYKSLCYARGALTLGAVRSQHTLLVQKTASGADAVNILIPGSVIQIVDTDNNAKRCAFYVKDVAADKLSCTAIQLTANPAFNVAVNDVININYTAFGEFGDKADTYHTLPETIFAETQTQKTGYKMSRREKKLVIGGNVSDFKTLIEDKEKEHDVKLERQILFGERAASTVEGNPFGVPNNLILDKNGNITSFSTGIFEVCNYAGSVGFQLSRMYDITLSTMTMATWVNIMQDVFQMGSQTKLFIAGDTLQTQVMLMANDQTRIGNRQIIVQQGNSTLELDVTEIKFGNRKLLMVNEPLLTGSYSKDGAIIDLEDIDYLVFDETTLTVFANTGPDGETGEILSDSGLLVKSPEKHAWVRGA